jgi:uncharacterized protein (TIGR02145 family)
MKRAAYITLLALSVGIFTTCEKFEVKPVTKVETGTATPLATSLVVNGNIIDLSGEGNTDHGFCYATQSMPTIDDFKVSKGNPKVGAFSGSIDGLTLNTQYYVRAYCQSAEGVVYGKTVDISTLDGQSALTTTAVTSITATTATSGGNITSDGGAAITARGVVWSTSQNPTTTSNQGITSNGSGTGSFPITLTNLQHSTVYYVRAYATNSFGTHYGNQQTFTTQDGVITLTTTKASNIWATTATSGGNITSDGGAPVTARGVVWSTSPNSTIESNLGITSNGAGTGIFASYITNLQHATVYYVRAYATNNFGTHYGNQVSFPTNGPGGTITDADGNPYNTIWINGHQWMKENLRTTKYRDGSSIPNVTDNGAWEGLSTPAYDWFNNDIANMPIYGALYNWYAINTGSLCPTGWHVPTDTEWTTLIEYAGGQDFAGGKLKATSGWVSGGNGTDDFGFSALPGGYRHEEGSFWLVGAYGRWWSSTVHETDATSAWYRLMSYNYGSVHRSGINKRYGFSVRCIKD